jgi:hypothetical protein
MKRNVTIEGHPPAIKGIGVKSADWILGYNEALTQVRSSLMLRADGIAGGGDKLVMMYVDRIVQEEGGW